MSFNSRGKRLLESCCACCRCRLFCCASFSLFQTIHAVPDPHGCAGLHSQSPRLSQPAEQHQGSAGSRASVFSLNVLQDLCTARGLSRWRFVVAAKVFALCRSPAIFLVEMSPSAFAAVCHAWMHSSPGVLQLEPETAGLWGCQS